MENDKINIAEIGLWTNGATMWIQSPKFVHVSMVYDDGWLKVYVNGKVIARMASSFKPEEIILTESGIILMNEGMSNEQLQRWSVRQKSKVGDGASENNAS